VTVRDSVHQTQRALELLFAFGAVLWAAAASIALLIAGAAAWIVILLGAVVFLALLWRARNAWSLERVALWFEERAPELRYSVVTAVDPRYASILDATVGPILERTDIARATRRTVLRSVAPAGAALLLAFAGFLIVPHRVRIRGTSVSEHAGALAILPNRLNPLTARVTPPQYARLGTVTLDDPSTISGWQGSRVQLTGRAGWSQSLAMTDTAPSILRLHDRQYTRDVIIDPHADQPPTVTLRLPDKDTTLRFVTGNLELAADITDDIGLGRAQFEFIVSSGEGEGNFTFREGTFGARKLDAERQLHLAVTVPFASLKLGEGDRVSVRAVAWDNNTYNGPGKGISETRTIRVARKSEYDTLSVNRAPPSADTAMISLRMLIIATEKLHAREAKTARPELISESGKLAGQSEAIRRKIQQIINETTGGGQIAPDTLLTTALGAMWDASRELMIASPGTALPPMYVAYKALQILRNTKRYYIRGIQQPIIVNIERVRLTGADTGHATPRGARSAERSNLDQIRVAYAQAVQLLRAAPDSAASMLMLMRAASLRVSPPLANALGDAIAAMQSGKDVTPALLRARRLLESAPSKLDSIPPWSGAWESPRRTPP